MPCLSSWKPGASPTNISSAVGEPGAEDDLRPPVCESAHFCSRRRRRRRRAARDQPQLPQLPPQQPPPPKEGCPAVPWAANDVLNCLATFVVAAVGAGRIGIRHADELLEVGLAAHADVFVDRHQDQPYQGHLRARPGRCRSTLPFARYPQGTGATTCSKTSPSSAPAAPARPSQRDCASVASPCARTASCGCSACPTGRSPRSRGRSSPDRGSRTSRAGRRSRRSIPTSRASRCTRCRRLTTARGPGAARRRLGGGHGRDADGHARAALARGDARPAPVRPRRRQARALPRRRVDRVELPRHALPRRVARSWPKRARRPRRSCR